VTNFEMCVHMCCCVAALHEEGSPVWIFHDVEHTSLLGRSPLHVMESPSLMSRTGAYAPRTMV
jgi:hypothetical protein